MRKCNNCGKVIRSDLKADACKKCLDMIDNLQLMTKSKHARYHGKINNNVNKGA